MSVVVVGSMMMDIILYTDKYANYGETILGHDVMYMPGGKGGNQASTLARLGSNPLFIGCCGDDFFGAALKQQLQKNGVQLSAIQTLKESKTGVAQIVIDDQGENTIVVVKGVNDSLSAEHINSFAEQIKMHSILLLQMETSTESMEAVMKIAKENGLLIVLDPAPAAGIDVNLLGYADIITPNAQETYALTQIEVHTIEDAIKAATFIEDKYNIHKVIIKMGKDGSLVYSNGSYEHVPALTVNAVDTVGAGDSFAGGLVYALTTGKQLIEAVHFATVVSGYKVTKHGAQTSLPDLDQLNQFYSSYLAKTVLTH